MIIGGTKGKFPVYSSLVKYYADDHCLYEGKIYKCLIDETVLLPTVTSDWEEIPIQGVQGPQGNTGIQGPQGSIGPQGSSFSQTINTITTSTATLMKNMVNDIIYSSSGGLYTFPEMEDGELLWVSASHPTQTLNSGTRMFAKLDGTTSNTTTIESGELNTAICFRAFRGTLLQGGK